jgi:hypothetical protein
MKSLAIFAVAVLQFNFCAAAAAQVPENAPRPKPDFPGRKAPDMTLEQATDIARKALTKQGTPLRGRFVSRAEFIFDPTKFPHEAAKVGKGPFWYVLLQDPGYASPEYPVAPIRVLVFADRNVAILAPQ